MCANITVTLYTALLVALFILGILSLFSYRLIVNNKMFSLIGVGIVLFGTIVLPTVSCLF